MEKEKLEKQNENYYWEQKAENFLKTGSYYG